MASQEEADALAERLRQGYSKDGVLFYRSA